MSTYDINNNNHMYYTLSYFNIELYCLSNNINHQHFHHQDFSIGIYIGVSFNLFVSPYLALKQQPVHITLFDKEMVRCCSGGKVTYKRVDKKKEILKKRDQKWNKVKEKNHVKNEI